MKVRNIVIYLVLLFLGFSLSTTAQPVNLSGYLKFFAHPNLNSPFPFDRLGSRLQLTLDRNLGSKAAFFASFDFNVEETRRTGSINESRAATTEIYPVETYIDLFLKNLDLRIGKQFIFWGTADWINPTDNLNPWDFKNIAAEIEDYRIAVSALKADYYLGDRWTLEGVWIPRFTPHKVPLTAPDSMGHLPVVLLDPTLPRNELESSEYAIRLASQLFQIDYSFSYYHGFDKNPSVLVTPEFDENFLPVRIVFEPHYFPLQVFGMDFVTIAGKFSLKGEGAYFLTQDRRGTDVFVENPHLQYVLGSDYNLSDDITLNAQFIQTIRLKYDRAAEIHRLRQLGNPRPNPPEKYTQSLSGRIHYQFADFSDVQVISVVNLQDGDFFLLPILTYGIADGLNIFAGATIFHGPSESLFGRNEPYSRAFLEIKFSF